MTYVVPWWSPSKFTAWDQCPQEFYRRYVLHQPIEPNVPMWFGTAVHKGLEAHYLGEDGPLAFRKQWRLARAELTEHGLRIRDDLFEIGLLLVEKTMALNLHGISERRIWTDTSPYLNAPLLGYTDLWCQDTHTIVDFKTTIGSWSAARAEKEQWQPCLYSMAYWLEVGVIPRFEYIVLNRATGTLERFETQRTEQQIADALGRARQISLAVATTDWTCTCRHHELPEAA